MRDLMLQFSNNIFIEILMLAICADTLLGVLRAIKFRQFNSSVGIDGAIRKVAMVVSVGILMLADLLIHVNLLAFIPEEYVHDLGVQKLGMCEFFCLLFTACECLSVLKNMVLCGPAGAEEGRKLDERFSCQYDIRAANGQWYK